MDRELLNILACPKCKGDVKERGMFLVCNSCRLAFPILDKKIPDMLIEDAWPIHKARKSNFKHNIEL